MGYRRSWFDNERKFNYDTEIFISKLEKALRNNLFENCIQKNEDVIGAIVLGQYCKNRSNPSTCTEKSCHLIGIILPPRRRCLPPISVFFITEALHTVPVPAQMASGTVRRQPHGKRLASVKGSS